MKKGEIFKRVGLFSVGVFGMLAALTTIVGNYFIKYALVPKKDGPEEREVVVDSLPDGVEKKGLEATQVITENAEQAKVSAAEWLDEIVPFTEEISIQSADDLTLKGHLFYQEVSTDKWVVLVHGYQGSEAEMHSVGMRYYAHGFNVLAFNHRGMKPSEGAYITMGIKEQHDLILWLNFLLERHPEAQIVNHGQSMGAATVLMASGLAGYPQAVTAVIADSGYTSVWDIFDSELYQLFKLPAFPILHLTGLVAYPKVSINLFTEGNVVQQVAQSRTPTMFIHGTADGFVPYPMVHTLYEAHPLEEKDLLIVEGAGHVEAKFLEPDMYYEKVFAFIENKF